MKIELLKSQNIALSKLETNKGQIEGLPKNPRLIKTEKFEKLKKSIEDNPEMLGMREVLVYPLGAKFVIIGGNMRFQACKDLGFTEVPCKVLDKETTAEQLRAITIKDNVGFGEHDWDLLANEWEVEELEEWGLDIPSFNNDEQVLEAEEDDYDVPDGGIETDIVIGDLFEIGEHRLLCGDSTDSDAVAKLMNGQKADISFTSPPYNVGGSVDNKNDNKKMYINSDDNLENYNIFLQDSLNVSFLYSNYSFYNLQLLSNNMLDILNWVSNNTIFVKDILIWNKKNCPPNIVKGAFNTKFEFIYCFDKNHKQGRNFPCSWQGKYNNVIDLESNLNNQETDSHRAGFPVSFPSWIIEKMDFANSILDQFLGTGTTMVAAHQLKRKCYGMELEPKYCQVIIDRMKKLDPTLIIKRNGQII
jgi:DNA modification methylase